MSQNDLVLSHSAYLENASSNGFERVGAGSGRAQFFVLEIIEDGFTIQDFGQDFLIHEFSLVVDPHLLRTQFYPLVHRIETEEADRRRQATKKKKQVDKKKIHREDTQRKKSNNEERKLEREERKKVTKTREKES